MCFSEQEILREELKSLQTLKNRLKQKVSELEEELKKTKEEAEKLNKSNKSDDEVSSKPISRDSILLLLVAFICSKPIGPYTRKVY